MSGLLQADFFAPPLPLLDDKVWVPSQRSAGRRRPLLAKVINARYDNKKFSGHRVDNDVRINKDKGGQSIRAEKLYAASIKLEIYVTTTARIKVNRVNF